MNVQTYKTTKGAERYAGEIARKFSSVETAVVPYGFVYAVLVTYPEPKGKTGLAGKRPRNYGARYPQDIMEGNFRIPAGTAEA